MRSFANEATTSCKITPLLLIILIFPRSSCVATKSIINFVILPTIWLTPLHGLSCVFYVFAKISFSGFDGYSFDFYIFLKLYQGFSYYNCLIYKFGSMMLQLLSYPTSRFVQKIGQQIILHRAWDLKHKSCEFFDIITNCPCMFQLLQFLTSLVNDMLQVELSFQLSLELIPSFNFASPLCNFVMFTMLQYLRDTLKLMYLHCLLGNIHTYKVHFYFPFEIFTLWHSSDYYSFLASSTQSLGGNTCSGTSTCNRLLALPELLPHFLQYHYHLVHMSLYCNNIISNFGLKMGEIFTLGSSFDSHCLNITFHRLNIVSH